MAYEGHREFNNFEYAYWSHNFRYSRSQSGVAFKISSELYDFSLNCVDITIFKIASVVLRSRNVTKIYDIGHIVCDQKRPAKFV